MEGKGEKTTEGREPSKLTWMDPYPYVLRLLQNSGQYSVFGHFLPIPIPK